MCFGSAVNFIFILLIVTDSNADRQDLVGIIFQYPSFPTFPTTMEIRNVDISIFCLKTSPYFLYLFEVFYIEKEVGSTKFGEHSESSKIVQKILQYVPKL